MEVCEIVTLCSKISDECTEEDVLKLQKILEHVNPFFFQKLQSTLLGAFYNVMSSQAQNSCKLSEDDKRLVVDTLKIIFAKTHTDQLVLFLNLFSFLLFQIYDHDEHKIKNIHEEYKLSIIKCMIALMNSTTTNLTTKLMAKENSHKLCRMFFVTLEIAKTEKMRELRIFSIKCLLALHKDKEMDDIIIRSHVALAFFFFLPGVAQSLKQIALCDEKYGHQLPKEAILAFGKLVSLSMEDFDNIFGSVIDRAKNSLTNLVQKEETEETDKLEEYLNSERTIQWFITSDKFLSVILDDFKKLTQHSHREVRKSLLKMCSMLINRSLETLQVSLRFIVEILIVLSEDEDELVKSRSKKILDSVAIKLPREEYQHLLECFIEGFYANVENLSHVFYGIDEKEQKSCLNLLTGYINLLSPLNFSQLIISGSFTHKMIITFLHVCEFEYDTSSMDENKIYDFDSENQSDKKWKKFKLIKSEDLLNKFETLIKAFSKARAFQLLTDYLISEYLNNSKKKEVTYMLNLLISGLKNQKYESDLVWSILNLYIQPNNWNIPLSIIEDEYGDKPTLNTVRNNIIQTCLHVEGVGIIAETLNKDEKSSILIKTLFLILTRAGSKHPLIQVAGVNTLKNLSVSYGHSNVTELIESNMDYFAFYIVQNLKKNNSDVFQVLSVVLKYGNLGTLHSLMSIIEEVLVQSCDRYKQDKIDDYLQTFHLFLKNLRKWLGINPPTRSFITRAQKEIKVTINGSENIEEISDFSDGIMNKSAAELWEEDMAKSQAKIEEEIYDNQVDEYKKPEPPSHIKLVVSLLNRSLNFLPSRDKERKILVLNILKDGLEIISDWEDELLPLVHLIWSPLVGRFKEYNEPIIVNFSFQLLDCMATLAKDFIRNRTANDVLPNIVEILKNLSKESFLKDKGSAYRYSQNYKLQIILLENLIFLICNVDFQDKDIEKIMNVVFLYLNKNQPKPLQNLAVKFFQMIVEYDPVFLKKINAWKSEGDYENLVNYFF